MVHCDDDKTGALEREMNPNGHELDQTVTFYFLDPHGKLHKTQQLPKEVEHFVWESRRTLETDEYQFTLAYSHSCEGYETILAGRTDLKENEREKIAGGFLGIEASTTSVDTPAVRAGGRKHSIDSILREIRKSLSADCEKIAKSVVVDTGFAGVFLLNCRRAGNMPAFKLVWRDDAYQIYAKERGEDQEVRLGAIRTVRDADLFCQLYEKLLLLNWENG